MKVKDLYKVISPFMDIQIGDSKRDVPLTHKSYIADSGYDDSYDDDEVYALIPKVDSEGEPYLAILIEVKA